MGSLDVHRANQTLVKSGGKVTTRFTYGVSEDTWTNPRKVGIVREIEARYPLSARSHRNEPLVHTV
jgi:hypothetical protein